VSASAGAAAAATVLRGFLVLGASVAAAVLLLEEGSMGTALALRVLLRCFVEPGSGGC
jgi:hypothetical protein